MPKPPAKFVTYALYWRLTKVNSRGVEKGDPTENIRATEAKFIRREQRHLVTAAVQATEPC
jgi:hypothetical protein